MRHFQHWSAKPDLYALIRQTRLRESERDAAIQALEAGEAVAEAIFWLKEKLAAVGQLFLRPILKR